MFIELVLIGNNTSTILTPTQQTCRNKYERVTPTQVVFCSKISCSKFSRMIIENCHYKSNLLSPCSTSPQTLVASIIINPD